VAHCRAGSARRSRQIRQRRQFGSAIAEFQGLQFMLADMAMQKAPISKKLRAKDLIALLFCRRQEAELMFSHQGLQYL
jgi:hypothetical protein